jgi:AraC family transcriptional regulator
MYCARGWSARRRCCARPRRVSWMSRWPAASKPSNILRECSVICVEPALENIGWNGGPAIDLNGATVQIHEQSLFRFCNSRDSQISASSLLCAAPIPQPSICTSSRSRSIQYFRRDPGFTVPVWHGHANAYELWSRDVRESFRRSKVLFNNEDPIAPVDGSTELKSTEISTFLGHSTLRRPSSIELGWKNFVIERRTTLPCEKPGVELHNHFLILWDVHVAEGEIAYPDGRFSPYKKYPNTITTRHEFRPTIRSRSNHEVIVGALRADFIRGIEEELDKPPSGTFHELYGTDDPELRNLLLLLVKESEAGGRCGTLYTESLIVALATRLLYAARLQTLPANAGVSPLPPRLLRRVLERMQADLSANIDLAALASESGYSRAHFLRTFRAATGQTPHRYLLEMRLAKAQALIAGRSIPLIDIALACGFSSHAHLTTAFRSRFGLSPSAYRRGL